MNIYTKGRLGYYLFDICSLLYEPYHSDKSMYAYEYMCIYI